MRALLALFLLLPALAGAQSPTGFDLQNPTARCNNVLYFDYGSANDGPAYFTAANGAVLCQAGGFCKGHEEQCKACIEKYWHCDAPQPAEPEKQ